MEEEEPGFKEIEEEEEEPNSKEIEEEEEPGSKDIISSFRREVDTWAEQHSLSIQDTHIQTLIL